WGVDATGLSVNPVLTNPGAGGTVGDATQLPTLTAYRISSFSSPMVNAGATVTSPGATDFYGKALFSGAPDIGSDECYLSASLVNTRNRRGSVIALDLPFLRILPLPDATIKGWDRCQLAGKYIGLASDFTTTGFK